MAWTMGLLSAGELGSVQQQGGQGPTNVRSRVFLVIAIGRHRVGFEADPPAVRGSPQVDTTQRKIKTGSEPDARVPYIALQVDPFEGRFRPANSGPNPGAPGDCRTGKTGAADLA